MGCAISGVTAESGGDGSAAAAGLPQLSDDQIQMIKASWKVIRDDIAKVGIIMFVRLFETHPECKDVFFLFRDVEDLERLRTSRELRAHGLRVMSFIEKSVARLDQLERLEALAVELGKSHYRYNAPPKYFSDSDVVGGRGYRSEGSKEGQHGGIGIPTTADQQPDLNLLIKRCMSEDIIDDRPVSV
ncbi:hypothetical protein NHX12_019245 [Muraenolepis orangiensis]|uniref:Globin domain-containing protein n=1 Tax=Muraenolepis orangiensis TaxID=630683 RepID=A0A9Q0IX15_9TELE|nr:hypothetical protein NHX12_019245 [Muraenolepis orangiensis]